MKRDDYSIYKLKDAIGRGEQADLRFACDMADRIVAAVKNANDVETLKEGFRAFRARDTCIEDDEPDPGRIYFHPLTEVGAPPKEIAGLGRFNPPQQPVLYLSTSREVALAESKALPSDGCTVATFKTIRPIIIAKLLQHDNISIDMLDEPETTDKFEKWLLLETAHFVSRYVQDHDRVVHYRTCNLIASAFRDSGFDALAYRTSYWSSGWRDEKQSPDESSIRSSNIVLFDPKAATPMEAGVFCIDWERPVAKSYSNSIWRAKEKE